MVPALAVGQGAFAFTRWRPGLGPATAVRGSLLPCHGPGPCTGFAEISHSSGVLRRVTSKSCDVVAIPARGDFGEADENVQAEVLGEHGFEAAAVNEFDAAVALDEIAARLAEP